MPSGGGDIDRATDWPEYLIERAILPVPEDLGVVPGSTPVVAFGHPLLARVATLGINPSSGEFLAKTGPLDGGRRRLATLSSLDVPSTARLTAEHGAQILDDCASYFDRNPYDRWFRPLDNIIRPALGASYYDGSACHLDLVQWATDPIWKYLDPDVRERLLVADLPFLEKQLQRENYRVVVVAGRTALEGVAAAGLVRWEPVAHLEAKPAGRVYAADLNGVRFVGWSPNIQSQPGARVHVSRLIETLREHAKEALVTQQDGSIARGTQFATIDELVGYMRGWLERCDDATVGDPTRFAGTPWIRFGTPAGDAAINADTTRGAVRRMVAAAARGLPWSVVANTRGKINKIVFDSRDSHAGWYAYLRKPLVTPREL